MKRVLVGLMVGVIIGLSIQCFALVIAADTWVTPTSSNGTSWFEINKAHDGNTGTYGFVSVGVLAWSSYGNFGLTSAIVSQKVRVWQTRYTTDIDLVEVGVYYEAAWHTIYSGAVTVGVYVEYAIGSVQIVTAMRVRYHNNHGFSPRAAYVWEVGVYGSPPVPGTVTLTPTYDLNYVGNNLTIIGIVKDTKSEIVVGGNVTWSVVGPGQILSCQNTTNSTGQIQAITTSFSAGNTTFSCAVTSNTSINASGIGEWVATGGCPAGEAAELNVFPSYSIVMPGLNCSVEAKFYDDLGCLIVGQSVIWTLTGPGNYLSCDNQTNAYGVAVAVLKSDVEGETLARCSANGTAFVYDFEISWSFDTGGSSMPLWYVIAMIGLAIGAWISRSGIVNVALICFCGAGIAYADQYLGTVESVKFGVYAVMICLIGFAIYQILSRVKGP